MRQNNNWEYCGRICSRCVDGIKEFVHTAPETIRSRRECKVKTNCPDGWETEAIYHTHPSGPWWGFSYGPHSDESTAWGYGRIYLGVGRTRLGSVSRLDGCAPKRVPPIKVWDKSIK
jgi:hypothetical protein